MERSQTATSKAKTDASLKRNNMQRFSDAVEESENAPKRLEGFNTEV